MWTTLLAQAGDTATVIAGAQHGVSWGTFWAVVSGIAAVLVAAFGLVWKHFDAVNLRQNKAIEAAALRQTESAERQRERFERDLKDVEEKARSARASAWQEHNSLRDRVTRAEGEIASLQTRAAETQAARIASQLDGG